MLIFQVVSLWINIIQKLVSVGVIPLLITNILKKTKGYSRNKWDKANDGMMAIFAEFAVCKDSGASADSAEAQALVAKLQAYITANYYTCTDEILAGLGKMYACDEWFNKNIDKCGDGTAEFAAEGIRIYVENK